jgi:hypothetical protein
MELLVAGKAASSAALGRMARRQKKPTWFAAGEQAVCFQHNFTFRITGIANALHTHAAKRCTKGH